MEARLALLVRLSTKTHLCPYHSDCQNSSVVFLGWYCCMAGYGGVSDYYSTLTGLSTEAHLPHYSLCLL